MVVGDSREKTMSEFTLQFVVEDCESAGGPTQLPGGRLTDRYYWFARDGIAVVEDCVGALKLGDVKSIADEIREETRGRYRAKCWFDDFVNYAEVGRRANVTPEAVRLWHKGARRGAAGFPPPIAFVGVGRQRSPIWRWGSISMWLDANGLEGGDGTKFPTEEWIALFNQTLCEEAAFYGGGRGRINVPFTGTVSRTVASRQPLKVMARG